MKKNKYYHMINFKNILKFFLLQYADLLVFEKIVTILLLIHKKIYQLKIINTDTKIAGR